MKARMTKEEFLVEVKKELLKTFGTQIEAAKYFKVERETLYLILRGSSKHVPEYILNFMGYEVDNKYVRIKK